MMIAATISGAIVNSVRLLTGRSATTPKRHTNGTVYGEGRNFCCLKTSTIRFLQGIPRMAFAFFGILLFANRRHGWWAYVSRHGHRLVADLFNVHHLSDVMAGALLGLVDRLPGLGTDRADESSGSCEDTLKQEFRSSGVQEFRSSGVQEFRSSGVQEFRSSGVQEFRSSGVQEFRSSGVQEFLRMTSNLFEIESKGRRLS